MWKIVDGRDQCCQRLHGGYQYWCVLFSSTCEQTKKTFGHSRSGNNLQISVSGQEHLCCGFLAKVKQMSE